MNTLEELYSQAAKGDSRAFQNLKNLAETGNHFAQYYLSCIYDKTASPFYDLSLAMSWLKKSAENGNPVALIKIAGFTQEVKNKYELNSIKNKNNGYNPNWTNKNLDFSPTSSYMHQPTCYYAGTGNRFWGALGRFLLFATCISLLRLCVGG